jgi:tetratricopeptide (TPR) repeat protein
VVVALKSTVDNELLILQSSLKLQGRFAEAIPIQQKILELAQQTGILRDVSNACNMLSHLFQLNGQLAEAEAAAIQALSIYADEPLPRLETLATYEMKLAMILAEQRRLKKPLRSANLPSSTSLIFTVRKAIFSKRESLMYSL